jgi:hypothetical protein
MTAFFNVFSSDLLLLFLFCHCLPFNMADMRTWLTLMQVWSDRVPAGGLMLMLDQVS